MSRRWKHKFEKKPGCWVFIPEDDVITRGREIKKEIVSRWSPPEYYAHLQKGGHISALKSHLSSDFFIRIDIHQFFNKINRSRVSRGLKRLSFPYKVALQFASDSVVRLPSCTQKKYILPFGFVQSPIIASLCLRYSILGNYLDRLTKNGFIVSVYMDDIIISSCLSKEKMDEIYNEILDVSEKSGFAINKEKSNGPCSSITAFNIMLSKGGIELVDERLALFRQAIHLSNSSQIKGILGYVRTVCPIQAKSLGL